MFLLAENSIPIIGLNPGLYTDDLQNIHVSSLICDRDPVGVGCDEGSA